MMQAGKPYIDDLVEKIKLKGKGNQYNCLIGLSGGADSSFLAKVVDLGLRPLAIHFDSGWNSEMSVNNMVLVFSLILI